MIFFLFAYDFGFTSSSDGSPVGYSRAAPYHLQDPFKGFSPTGTVKYENVAESYTGMVDLDRRTSSRFYSNEV
jgi:hypothetical protein